MNTRSARNVVSADDGGNSAWRPRLLDTSEISVTSANAREKWRSALRKRLAALTTLSDNWDSYHGGAIKAQTVLFAAQVLDDIWAPGLPVPDVAPTSSESVYCEWVNSKFDFSIEVRAPYSGKYFFEDATSGNVREGEFQENLRELELLTHEAIASSAAR